MYLFAEEYVAQNPGAAPNVDSLYTLCFAIVMLNTDLHRPDVQVRMSVDQFVSMVPTSGGYPMPTLLQDIYARVAANSLFWT